MDHLYIRHTVGGQLFYDSKQHGAGFAMEATAEGDTRFTLTEIDLQTASGLTAHRDDLNIFLVTTGEQKRKSWFYTSEGRVEYDAESRTVTILADKRLDYNVE